MIDKHEHVDDIGCMEAIEWLHTWLDGELDDESVERLEQHIRHCRSCFSRSQMERRLTERMQAVSAKKPASAKLKSRLDQLISKL